MTHCNARPGGRIVRCSAFHSADPAAPKVYHDSTRCQLGNAIPLASLRMGSNGYDHCAQCQMYNWM